MASGAKCFVLNRESDWKDSSILSNVEFKGDCLVSQNKSGENGVYISGVFDSLQAETVWHRMRLDVDIPQSAIFKLRIYASDVTEVRIPVSGETGQSKVDINEYISNKSIDINRKIDMFDHIGATMYENPTDVLLYDLQGRYLWICIEMINYENERIKFKEVKIEFPKISFVDYLPEIYRYDEATDAFLTRFMGIFQSIYVDLEDQIDYTPVKYDVDRANKDFLDWIADWLSVKDASIWGEKKLRKIIKEAVNIYKMKGTKRAIAKIVQEYSGMEPIIVEQFDVKPNMYYDKQRNVVENLFGDNGYVFTVILPESHVPDAESYVELMRVINSVKPVDSICNLVILGDKLYLDHHCYMGMNSYIAKNRKLVLNKQQEGANDLMIVNSD